MLYLVSDLSLVLWHTFGLTHNTRVEDFPVVSWNVLWKTIG